ncbi:hypothetical protein BHAOGJBA_1288 [Methylobacterium hispanicum]|uniref:Uncharacterized protein n=2 Tax=Methylobacterium hispanicum TaxID=270350 RepID=A0AAV4ZIR3_9HYPH|nr:hypothetical protein BHAOGJBA_1288 [Methylobacterium hispanicum]
MNRRDFDRLHAAPVGVASVLSGFAPSGIIGMAVLITVACCALYGFTQFMENKAEILPLLALAGLLFALRLTCRVFAAQGMPPRRTKAIGYVGTIAFVLLIEGGSGAVGNFVARITSFNPFVALQGATGVAIGPFAAEAKADGIADRYGRATCLAAKANGRLVSGKAEDQDMAYGCRLIIGTGHMYRYCGFRYRPRYSEYATNYDNGTACGPYLRRYYWQKGEI